MHWFVVHVHHHLTDSLSSSNPFHMLEDIVNDSYKLRPVVGVIRGEERMHRVVDVPPVALRVFTNLLVVRPRVRVAFGLLLHPLLPREGLCFMHQSSCLHNIRKKESMSLGNSWGSTSAYVTLKKLPIRVKSNIHKAKLLLQPKPNPGKKIRVYGLDIHHSMQNGHGFGDDNPFVCQVAVQ